MRKLLILFCCWVIVMPAQQQLVPEKPFIEVSGQSETEIVPDIIEVHITLREYVEGKSKMDINKQEADLKKNLKELGIDLKDLTVVTAFADFGRVRLMKKDVVNSKTYLLKVNSAELLSKVYERLDQISVHDARIIRLDHTKIKEHQKENRMKAIKAAREKAEYILAAIGKTAGDPLQVTEGENWVEHGEQGRAGSMYNVSTKAMRFTEDAMAEEELSIRTIKVRSGFSVKFEIK